MIGSVRWDCDASQNPHRAWKRGQESGGAQGCGALSVGCVPRRPSLMGGGTSQKLGGPGVAGRLWTEQRGGEELRASEMRWFGSSGYEY